MWPSNSNDSTARRGPTQAGGYLRSVSSSTISSSGSSPEISWEAVGCAAGEQGVLLGQQAGDDLGVAGELVEHERDRRGGGVVAGEQERHDLVADLHVAERVAVLVVGVEQQAEDVRPALARGAAAGDLGVDQRVELARRLLHARPGRAAVRAARAGSSRVA